ncbi:MAG: universal stress protein [Nitrososphaerota archaeon]|nr:universal stress protein [Nitrososphaerota archaeon]
MHSRVMGVTGYAEKNVMDLMVVGTSGLEGFKRLVLGSFSRCVIYCAHCNVLVVS